MVERIDIVIGLGLVAVVAGGVTMYLSQAKPKHVPLRPGEGIIEAVIDTDKCGVPTYPAESAKNNEQGATLLDMLVDVDGNVIDSKVTESSGFPRLDEAARKALSLCHFKPETVDGDPVLSWNPLRYTWRLVDPTPPPAPPPPAAKPPQPGKPAPKK